MRAEGKAGERSETDEGYVNPSSALRAPSPKGRFIKYLYQIMEDGDLAVKRRARCGPTPLHFGDNKHRHDYRISELTKQENQLLKDTR